MHLSSFSSRLVPAYGLLLSVSVLFGQCRKRHDPTPLEQLPPATQTGADTFGCLLNGQAWRPKGFNGTSNYSVDYDPTYQGGTLNLFTYRLDQAGKQQVIGLFSDSLTRVGTYPLIRLNHAEPQFSDEKTGCEFLQGGPQYRAGTLTITRLDRTARIVSGTFHFKLYQPGCDSVIVTEGRFDKQL